MCVDGCVGLAVCIFIVLGPLPNLLQEVRTPTACLPTPCPLEYPDVRVRSYYWWLISGRLLYTQPLTSAALLCRLLEPGVEQRPQAPGGSLAENGPVRLD